MEEILLRDIPTKIDEEKLITLLHLKKRNKQAERAVELAREVQKIARPIAYAREAYIESKDGDKIVIEGIPFMSRVMAVNLKDTYRVFPFVATSGWEVENWSSELDNLMDKFYADQIKIMLLENATNALTDYLKNEFQIDKLAAMNPGSLEDWPLAEQQKLFSLLGDVYEKTGVKLNPSFLMIPLKSTSGILFPTEVDYKNCQLCSRKNCPGRKAPYNPELLKEKYKLEQNVV